MNLDLKGKSVLVTGGNRGVGLAIALAFAEEGANVAVCGRDRAALADAEAKISAKGVKAKAVAVDLFTAAGCTGAVQAAVDAFGGLDVLVNNASTLGATPLRLLADTDCEDLEAALATNLVGPFRLSKALLGTLAASAREGRAALIVNITSDAAVTPYASWGAYGASKAALLQLSRIWDEELREHGVRVLALDPGDMDTPLHAAALPDADPATLKRPADSARDIVALIAAAPREREGVSA